MHHIDKKNYMQGFRTPAGYNHQVARAARTGPDSESETGPMRHVWLGSELEVGRAPHHIGHGTYYNN
jgi:hypothetical protein